MNREVVAGFAVFVVAVAATAAVTAAGTWPPWLPVGLLVISATLAGVAGFLVRRAGDRPGPGTLRHEQPAAQDPGIAGKAEGESSESNTGQVLSGELDRLLVDVRGRQVVVAAGDIEWIEAAGNYARLHLADTSFLYRMSLARLTRSLGRSGFVRVHKSALVNLRAVDTVDPISSGDAVLHLISGAEVRMSRRYARHFHERTGRPR